MGKQIDFLFQNMARQVEKDGKFPEVLMGTRAEKVIQGILKNRNNADAEVQIGRRANNG